MIRLNISDKKFVPKYLTSLMDYTHRWEVYYGSAGSAKSYFVTQKLLMKALKDQRRILITRRYKSTMRESVFKLFKNVIKDFGLTKYCKVRETDFHIQLPNGSEIIFVGLDDEEKLLSITDISDVFVEEAYEVPKSVVDQLNIRMRGNAKDQQIILAFNPISSKSWIYDFCVTNPPASFKIMHSTYKDNPFLPQAYIDALDEMEIANPNKYRIYGKGEWGVDPEGLVFSNWSIEEFNPQELSAKGYEQRVGSDLGYIDATTISCSLYNKQDKVIYVYDEYYKNGAQLDAVVVAMETMKLQRQKIWMDQAEPRSIAFFRENGFTVVGAKKGAGSIELGEAFLQNHKIIVHPSCIHTIEEFDNYAYLKDKQTDKYTAKTDHRFSHIVSGALRYAYADVYGKHKLKTMNKSALGL